VQRAHAGCAKIGEKIAQIPVPFGAEAVAETRLAVVPGQADALAEAAQDQNRQVESASVPGDHAGFHLAMNSAKSASMPASSLASPMVPIFCTPCARPAT